MKPASNDISDSVQAESNIQDVVALVANMRKNNECLLHCAVFIELKAASLDEAQRPPVRYQHGTVPLQDRHRQAHLKTEGGLPVGKLTVFRTIINEILKKKNP